jgi:cytosine/adenosine deaminase-related metal-dependent hydrolase
VWFAHLVKCEPDELALMAEAGTAMAHCPQANARLGSGIAPAPAFAKIGGLVSLAVDGTGATEAGDMAQALYSAFTIHRAVGGADATRAENVLILAGRRREAREPSAWTASAHSNRAKRPT